MRRTVAALLAVILILSVQAFPALAEPPAAYTIEKKVLPFTYCFDEEAQSSEINLYFFNGGDVPYIALGEFLPVLAEMYNTRYECREDARVTFDLQVTGQSGSNVFTSSSSAVRTTKASAFSNPRKIPFSSRTMNHSSANPAPAPW